MANHKWVNTTEYKYGSKPQECKKCGITREWYGGEYQCWAYIEWYNDRSGFDVKFTRPDCVQSNK